jgi:glycosyltransferase involved in cell wall biosynthesis
MMRAEEEGVYLLIATRPPEDGLTGQPYISVIVTAYNRRRYLPFALRSLEAQTLLRDRFEVIVVKNFDDKKSDGIISRNGWKDVYNDDLYQGRMVLAGLEEAKGEVITFLDDDDMYVNNRLEEVYKAFTSFKRLVYFQNSQAIIDSNGNVLERPPLLISKNLIGGNPIVVDVDRLRALAKKYNVSVADLVLKVRARADFNSSSLAVRRSALEVSAHLLRELPISVDSFTFASSLKAGGLMYFTDEKLTFYRVHGGNWTPGFASEEGNEAYLRRVKAFLQGMIAYRLIGHRLLNDDINIYLCVERFNKRWLQLFLQPELGTLPPELRPSLSDVKLALRCYKVKEVYESLADVAFVMGRVLFGPLLASPKGRDFINKLANGIRKGQRRQEP